MTWDQIFIIHNREQSNSIRMPGWMSFLLTLLVDELHPDKRERLLLIKRIIDSHLSSTNEAASPFHPPVIGWPRLATDRDHMTTMEQTRSLLQLSLRTCPGLEASSMIPGF
jgi:hypothetical protein